MPSFQRGAHREGAGDLGHALVEGAPLRRHEGEGRLIGGARLTVRRVQVVHHARPRPGARQRLRPHLRPATFLVLWHVVRLGQRTGR
jgi:hypothetical protein